MLGLEISLTECGSWIMEICSRQDLIADAYGEPETESRPVRHKQKRGQNTRAVAPKCDLMSPKKTSGMHRCIPESTLKFFLEEVTSSFSWLSSLPFYSPLQLN
jgi:hypothetical protein